MRYFPIKIMEILAVLPMRGGSKGIPKKSIYPVLGRPLAAYAIREALRSKRVSRFVAYTDDADMAAVAREYGFEVPVERPSEVSSDTSTDVETFQRLLRQLKEAEGYEPDIVVHLRATALRRAEDIDAAVDLLIADPNADCVRGVCEPDLTPFKMYWYKNEGDVYIDYFLRDAFPSIFQRFPEPSSIGRQNFPAVWQHSAQIDVTRARNIVERNSMSGKNILPLFVDKSLDIDIDRLEDFGYLEYLIKKLGKDF
ncbi:MAG: acylneuraminate cytidylyltransferase family protein [Candidatus Yanofskybacteria bacterium]|nr:acylneuraminate cytidylyltransferase family protein [Candidatus Yanofskybacteria bacterium]